MEDIFCQNKGVQRGKERCRRFKTGEKKKESLTGFNEN